jgi:hypothetical protein
VDVDVDAGADADVDVVVDVAVQRHPVRRELKVDDEPDYITTVTVFAPPPPKKISCYSAVSVSRFNMQGLYDLGTLGSSW